MNKLKMFPQLTTERLILRQLCHFDAEDVHTLRNDESVNAYIQVTADRKKETGLGVVDRMQQEFLSNNTYYWVISLKTDLKLIGNICLWNFSDDLKKAELGYSLFEPFRGRGLMSEAVEAVLDYGFNTKGFQTIEAYTHYENENSTNLLKKFGFKVDVNQKDAEDEKNIIFVKHKNPRN